MLKLYLEWELNGDISKLLDGQTGTVLLRTRNSEFNALNARLGLAAVHSEASRDFTFYFDDYVNIPAAAEAYEKMEGVRRADPIFYSYEGYSDIDAVKSEERWYVSVVYDVSHCDCEFPRWLFFIDAGTGVERVGHAQATDMTEFRALIHSQSYENFGLKQCPANVRVCDFPNELLTDFE